MTLNAHFQINASYLLNTTSMLLKSYQMPPCENYSKILGITREERTHSIHSVSCLIINEAVNVMFKVRIDQR